MKVVEKPIGDIRPYPGNPRTVTDHAVAELVKSIEQYGWRQPIVVDADGVIVAGSTRYLAALSLGLETVPVHVARDLTEEQAREYRIADNRTADLTDWEFGLLVEEMKKVDAPVPGFTEEERYRVMGVKMPMAEPRAAPKPKEAAESAEEVGEDVEMIGVMCPECGYEFEVPALE